MPLEFASEEDLLERLTARSHDLVYLVGSAITTPCAAGEPGVPPGEGIIAEIRRIYTQPAALARFDEALAAEPQHPYRAAFRFLQRTRGQDEANAIIRRCVLQARVPSAAFPQVHVEIAERDAAELCLRLELDVDGWHLPPAVQALGHILAKRPVETRPAVLTSNFDPLITVSLHRAGGRALTTALHSDGGFAAIFGHGTLVVHFHGDWFRSDTLHTAAQIGQERPRLAASLTQLLAARTLVVLGHDGWDDIFNRSLIAAIRGEVAAFNVLWTFHEPDEQRLVARHAQLLAELAPGIERVRVALYKGIDVHTFLPRLAEALGATPPAAPTPRLEQPAASKSPVRSPYRSAGTFRGDAYIERDADAQLREAIEDNQYYPYIMAPRQSGKSSLLARTMAALSPERYRCALVDLSPFVVTTYDDFWLQFLREVAQGAGFDPGRIGAEDPRDIFLRWLRGCTQHLVVFIDEVDVLPALAHYEQILSKFRVFYNSRGRLDLRELERLQFVLAGGLAEFGVDPRWSPFNVAQIITLDDLSAPQVDPLVGLLARSGAVVSPGLSAHLHSMTGGAVLLCQLVLERLWAAAVRGAAELGAHDVDAAVAAIVADSAGHTHFHNIAHRMTRDPAIADSFRRMCRGHDLSAQEQRALELVGMCRGMHPFRNEIYAQVFGRGGPLDLMPPRTPPTRPDPDAE